MSPARQPPGGGTMIRLLKTKRRPGFTLVELLVVIAIIAVLIALLVPAVQKVREAANKAQCQNNLKQLGLALHNYHGCYLQFPPGGVTTPTLHGWGTYILPYIGQQPLYERYHWDLSHHELQNQDVAATQLDIFQCPSAEPDRF